MYRQREQRTVKTQSEAQPPPALSHHQNTNNDIFLPPSPTAYKLQTDTYTYTYTYLPTHHQQTTRNPLSFLPSSTARPRSTAHQQENLSITMPLKQNDTIVLILCLLAVSAVAFAWFLNRVCRRVLDAEVLSLQMQSQGVCGDGSGSGVGDGGPRCE
ncbi:hypothetical protein BDU57DRAFT_162712 [Ampelomyces quisqualis]|uniref:Uncharacterized protein n=1 Tax=Ampelomyces quisqualis TaxID=50730 RepID=A0A6A5QR61_AMPQU|nr:hypothetical protein BDU57DRAFT_162712 [Ampelomyces quisqualis]